MAAALQIEPDWDLFYLISITFVLFLNWIHLFVLKLVYVSSGGLAYTRQNVLDVNIL